jgi:hypothetical protein
MRRRVLLMALLLPVALFGCGGDDEGGTPAPTPDTTDPTVAFVAPQNGENVPAAEVPLRAAATDDQGVARVEFFVDGVKIGEDATATAGVYESTWDATGWPRPRDTT